MSDVRRAFAWQCPKEHTAVAMFSAEELRAHLAAGPVRAFCETCEDTHELPPELQADLEQWLGDIPI
jgi:hypothetical protein